MELMLLLDLAIHAIDAAFLGFVAYGGYLVMGGGGFRRDAPEDAALPHFDVSHDGA